jgi:hypothetical protein
MYLDKIIKYINKLVSNTSSFRLNYGNIDFYLDRTIDHINETLITNFRTISEYFEISKFYSSVLKYINSKEDFIIEGYITDDGILYYDQTTNKIYYKYILGNGDIQLIEFTKENSDITYVFYINNLNIFITYKNGEWGSITEELHRDIPIYDTVEKLGYEYFDYNELPDRYIRNCVIYYAAGLYLEEEDELENQHDTYLKKADEELASWRKEHFSCYELGTGKAVIYEQ